jgi:hypothetical protein
MDLSRYKDACKRKQCTDQHRQLHSNKLAENFARTLAQMKWFRDRKLFNMRNTNDTNKYKRLYRIHLEEG